MNKKIFFISILAISPLIAFAAGNDVTLTTDTILSVNGITLNVSGGNATLQSITVNPTNFTVTLASGSSVTIVAPGLNQLTNDTASDVGASTCTASASSLTLTYSGGGSVTNTITPSTSLCSGSGSSPTPTPTPTVSYSSSGGSISSSALAKLLVPGTTTTAYLNSLNKKTTPIPASPSTHVTFTKDLQVGSIGSDVKALQIYLNTHGYTITSSGVGSLGHETTSFGSLTKKAVMKLQKAHKLPVTGFFGPKTRAVINSNL